MTATATQRRLLDEMFEAGLKRSSIADEQAVLGAMMLAKPDSGIAGIIRTKLTPRDPDRGNGRHHFYRPAHQNIWDTILELIDDGQPHDELTVTARMDAATLQRIGGAPYLHTCIEAVPTVLNGPTYARDLAGATLLREMAEGAAQQVQRVLASSLHGAVDTYGDVRAVLDAIEVPTETAGPVAWERTTEELSDELERLSDQARQPDQGRGEFSTGWYDMDQLLCPVVPGAMIVVAGRPGMAKTTVAVNLAAHLTMEKRLPVLFFSLEMSRIEIGLKALCSRARVRGDDIKHGTLSDEDWAKVARRFGEDKDAPLDIDDAAGITMDYVDRELAAFVRRHGRAPVAFVIDHIGLVTEHGGRDTREKTDIISRRIKVLAKKYGTVAIALCQLNRGPEQRQGGRPQMSDLRNSGSIEQDADIVILLHREDYYDKESTRAGEMDAIVAKHRNGPTDEVILAAQLHWSRIASVALAG